MKHTYRQLVIGVLAIAGALACHPSGTAQFHVELGYRYAPGFSEQVLGECIHRDQLKMYGNTVHVSFLYDITPRMAAGVGIGANLCETGTHFALPIFATFRYSPLAKLPSLYAFTELGYAPPIGSGKSSTWQFGVESTRYNGLNYGWLWNIGAGYRIMFRKHFGLNFQIYYNLQQYGGTNVLLQNADTGMQYYTVSNNLRHSLGLGVALVF